jgi:cytidylate kinase
MSQPPELLETGMLPNDETPPRHGFQGDRGAAPAARAVPQGLSITVSRESGARGGTIARLVATKLGWQVYDRDILEYMAQDTVVHQGILDSLSPAAAAWVEARLAELHDESNLAGDPAIENLARLVLALGAQGEAVLIGRGAGCILPRESTLNVRIVAPLPQRIAYMAQWMRLSVPEATEKVRSRDERRAEFLRAHFSRSPGDVHQYDMVLSSTMLGEEGCAEVIAQGAHIRWTLLVERQRS